MFISRHVHIPSPVSECVDSCTGEMPIVMADTWDILFVQPVLERGIRYIFNYKISFISHTSSYKEYCLESHKEIKQMRKICILLSIYLSRENLTNNAVKG